MIQARAWVEVFAAIVLGFILLTCICEKNKTKQDQVFIAMLISNLLALLSEAVIIAYYGTEGIDTLLTVVNTFSYISGYMLIFFYICFVCVCINQDEAFRPKIMPVMVVLGIISSAGLILGNYFKVFSYMENGIFVMTKYFLFSFAYDIVGVGIAAYFIIRYRKNLSRRDLNALLTMPVLAIIMILGQYFLVKKATLIYIFTMLSCLCIYLMIQLDRVRRMALQKQQMKELHTQLMLSQIQPHFIFNSLSSIRRLIQKDQETAVKAIEEFSLYLRKNLDSLSSNQPVSFQRELEHTREYLYLEALRFGERLCIKYDIQTMNFYLPVLTLQPIVENAVKHGVLEKEEGGTVWIVTRETEKGYVIEVKDDGVGFDVNKIYMDDTTHIGIRNVAYRLKLQSRGELTIESKQGEGTKVTIEILKM